MRHRQASLVERFVKFVCLVHIKGWIWCPLPAEAGISDLELLSRIPLYLFRGLPASMEADKIIISELTRQIFGFS